MAGTFTNYLGGVIRGEKGVLYEIGGMANHVHLLIRWRPDETISDLVRTIKRNTTIWIHDAFPELSDFYWQEGYGAFTVSYSQVDKVKVYIQNQEGITVQRISKWSSSPCSKPIMSITTLRRSGNRLISGLGWNRRIPFGEVFMEGH